MLALFYALATFDYQLLYVARHSARSMALHYRLAALWGGQAGSLLLWLWMLMAYSAASVWFNRTKNRTLMPWVVVGTPRQRDLLFGSGHFRHGAVRTPATRRHAL